jgi:hypothetical protein
MPTKKKPTDEPAKLTSQRLLKNRPLDAEKDTVEVRPKGAVFAEAAAQVGPENIEEPKQRELLASPEAAQKPSPVQNGRMLATYVGLGLKRDKDGEKLIELNFSFPLEASHNGHIPKRVKDAWLWLSESGNKAVQVIDIPAVTLDVYLDPKVKEKELHLVGCEFTKAIISLVEESGAGKSVVVTRFAFRLLVERMKNVVEFAAWNDEQTFWVTLNPTQKSLEE